jgi:sialate O-acetylesterase
VQTTINLPTSYLSKKIPSRSPEYKSAEFAAGKAVVTLDTFGSNLYAFDVQEVKGLAMCGEDKKWVWATGKIVGTDKIEVSAHGVAKPIVRSFAVSDGD